MEIFRSQLKDTLKVNLLDCKNFDKLSKQQKQFLINQIVDLYTNPKWKLQTSPQAYLLYLANLIQEKFGMDRILILMETFQQLIERQKFRYAGGGTVAKVINDLPQYVQQFKSGVKSLTNWVANKFSQIFTKKQKKNDQQQKEKLKNEQISQNKA